MAQFELFGYVPSSIVFRYNGDFTYTNTTTINPLDGNGVDLSSHPGRAIFAANPLASFKTDQPILLYDVYYSGAGTLNISLLATDDTTLIPIVQLTGVSSVTRLNQFIPAGSIVVITSSGGGAANRVEITGKQAKSDASV